MGSSYSAHEVIAGLTGIIAVVLMVLFIFMSFSAAAFMYLVPYMLITAVLCGIWLTIIKYFKQHAP